MFRSGLINATGLPGPHVIVCLLNLMLIVTTSLPTLASTVPFLTCPLRREKRGEREALAFTNPSPS